MKAGNLLAVRGFDLPTSSFLDGDTRAVLRKWEQRARRSARRWPSATEGLEAIRAHREWMARKFYPPILEKYIARYGCKVQEKKIAGVPTELITPARGVSRSNRGRVLINLHNGGFIGGARFGGRMESMPIASTAGLPIVSVDYRLAPEHAFPAATQDVVAVYRALLRKHDSQAIGIFGCSAGGVLTAQVVASLQREQLPIPGAVGLLSGAAHFWTEGDSGHFVSALLGDPGPEQWRDHPYFSAGGARNPLLFPGRSQQVLSAFPPSLLISATRDCALSSVVHTHSCLVKARVEAHLHVWEGLDHAFFLDPDLPQSREVYEITSRFFLEHLV